MAGNAEDLEALNTEWDPTDHFPFRHIERCSKLWVAKVNGLCVAGGMDLALHCDVVIASDQARFRVPELLRGIPDPFMSARLVAAVGLVRARYLFFTADEIGADEAAVMGIVGKVVPHAELDAEAERVLAAIASTGPLARAAIKRDINRRLPVHDTDLMRRSIGTPEMMEGMRAFVEKREVRWPR
jgi:enoyl-CoA hydratase/carnithine racemase